MVLVDTGKIYLIIIVRLGPSGKTAFWYLHYDICTRLSYHDLFLALGARSTLVLIFMTSVPLFFVIVEGVTFPSIVEGRASLPSIALVAVAVAAIAVLSVLVPTAVSPLVLNFLLRHFAGFKILF